ncbi:hypothetical protein PR202_ga29076 [Eleusine coracana subsp. coracana]|uniref:Malate dehydrogenase n=1 Tax=Eleusine coracana subsp. coracana TaxID=191504 RepID=A0AAV5DKW1_ELECO|nr:hypothetical protein PR202_ga29076 [Eleusine coracana subsp. coracana]
MAAAAIATLSFISSVPRKKLLGHGASTSNPQQLSGCNPHWHSVISLKPRTPSRSRAATRAIVARAGGTYKVAVLGAAGAVGQPLSLLIKMSPLVSTLHLYDVSDSDVKGVAADLGHCNTPARVAGFSGAAELASCLAGADLVVVIIAAPAGGDDPINPSATTAPDDLTFAAAAGVVVDSAVPVAAETLKRKGAYDPRRLLGVTTLDVVRANTLVAGRKGLPLADVDVPVVGGPAGPAALPLLSKARPKAAFTEEEVEVITARVRERAGTDEAPLSAAYAAARLVEAALRGLGGEGGVYECAYVQSQVVPELPFFACRVRLGKEGVEEVVGSELRGVSDYEARALEELKPLLKASIDRGVAYVQQQPTEAALN